MKYYYIENGNKALLTSDVRIARAYQQDGLSVYETGVPA